LNHIFIESGSRPRVILRPGHADVWRRFSVLTVDASDAALIPVGTLVDLLDAEGVAQLDALVAQLPRSDHRQVDQAIEAARRRIANCAPAGCPPMSWSRSNRGVRGSVARVDIAIYTGSAFT
jgi:hypothetical protein